jgi:hypothetical protein
MIEAIPLLSRMPSWYWNEQVWQSGQLYTQAALPPGEKPPATQAPEPIWIRLAERWSPLCRKSNPCLLSLSTFMKKSSLNKLFDTHALSSTLNPHLQWKQAWGKIWFRQVNVSENSRCLIKKSKRELEKLLRFHRPHGPCRREECDWNMGRVTTAKSNLVPQLQENVVTFHNLVTKFLLCD